MCERRELELGFESALLLGRHGGERVGAGALSSTGACGPCSGPRRDSLATTATTSALPHGCKPTAQTTARLPYRPATFPTTFRHPRTPPSTLHPRKTSIASWASTQTDGRRRCGGTTSSGGWSEAARRSFLIFGKEERKARVSDPTDRSVSTVLRVHRTSE